MLLNLVKPENQPTKINNSLKMNSVPPKEEESKNSTNNFENSEIFSEND